MSSNRDRRIVFERLYAAGERSIPKLIRRVAISRRIAYNYLRKLENGESLEPEPQHRGPRKFTPEIRRSMSQLSAKKPSISDKDIADELGRRFGGSYSRSGVWKVFKTMGNRHAVSEPRQLTAANKAARLAYANENLNRDWSRMWSYDECYFNLWRRRSHVRFNNRTLHRTVYRPPTNSQEAVSIGICLAFSRNHISKVCFLPRNWHVPDLSQVWENDLLPDINWDPHQHRCRAFIIDNNGKYLHHHQPQNRGYNSYQNETSLY